MSYRRSDAERVVGGPRPLVKPRLVEERLHRRRPAIRLDRPDATVSVDAEVPAAAAASLSGRRRHGVVTMRRRATAL